MAKDNILKSPLQEIIAVWPHEGRAAELVCKLKYERSTAVVSALAQAMAALSPQADLVTWIPASPSRRRKRGFDQSELLARAVARRQGVRVKRLLRRTDDLPQTARDRQGRISGPRLVSRGPPLRRQPSILVIDDVTTTGTTLHNAADILRQQGAGAVYGLVATRSTST